MRRLILACACVATSITAGAQTRAVPYLYLEIWNQQGVVRPGADGFITVANNERVTMRVMLKVPAVSDRFEQLEILAGNQHPDYFKNRPPANITIQVRQGTTSCPVRIVSSGGGKNVTVYNVDADFDILEARDVRQQHVRDFLTWMFETMQTADPAATSRLAPDKEAFLTRSVPVYDEMYINNPVGLYEVTARYAPSTPENWRGVLTTPPIKLRVIFRADFFDVMKGRIGKHEER